MSKVHSSLLILTKPAQQKMGNNQSDLTGLEPAYRKPRGHSAGRGEISTNVEEQAAQKPVAVQENPTPVPKLKREVSGRSFLLRVQSFGRSSSRQSKHRKPNLEAMQEED